MAPLVVVIADRSIMASMINSDKYEKYTVSFTVSYETLKSTLQVYLVAQHEK
jgi:hypothetical protein